MPDTIVSVRSASPFGSASSSSSVASAFSTGSLSGLFGKLFGKPKPKPDEKDVSAPDEEPPQLTRQTSTVFRELGEAIVNYLSLADLVFVALCINRSFSDAARARIGVLWPQLSPLLSPPFNLMQRDLLLLTTLDLRGRNLGDPHLQALAAACAIGALPNLKTLALDKYAIQDGNDTSLNLSGK
jgi:hypothetical protein